MVTWIFNILYTGFGWLDSFSNLEASIPILAFAGLTLFVIGIVFFEEIGHFLYITII